MKRRDGSEFFERLSAVARMVRVVAAKTYDELDVGSLQAKCLRTIGEQKRMSQAAIARATTTDPALIGRVLESLLERGWVKRERSDEDRRQYVLELTASGQRARKRVDEARRALAKRIASVLDERDIADFDRIATKVLAELGPDDE